MNLFGTIALGSGLIFSSTASLGAGPENWIRANAVVCATKFGIEATHADMNAKQLQSLGCASAPVSLRVHVLPPSGTCDSYLFVAATLPDKVLRYWINRDELDDKFLDLTGDEAPCRSKSQN
jgi:hypothetical protein